MGRHIPIPTDKSRSLMVIGAGASRTGTMSLSLALEKLLDGPVMHGGHQLLLREDSYVKLIRDLLRQRNDMFMLMKLLGEATAGFVGIADCPGSLFVPELLELYPDAKVVLVSRDPERWVQSMTPLHKHWNPWWFKYLVWPYPGWRWLPDILNDIKERECERLPSLAAGRPVSAAMLEEHNSWVKRNVPPEKLLIMELGEGWEPLCRFLDMPVPNEPFPHVNDAKALQRAALEVVSKCLRLWGIVGLIACFCMWVLYRAAKS